MKQSAVRRVTSDGLEIVVEELGEGPPIVFAHGLTGNRLGVLSQLGPLADRHRVVAYDQRGHGASARVIDPDLYHADRMAEDMTAVLDALGIERAVVGGESMGAATAMLFALAHPERVRALLITAPAFGDRPNPQRQRLKDMAAGIRDLGMDAFLARVRSRFSGELGWPAGAAEHVCGTFASHDPASVAIALDTVADWLPIPDLTVLRRLGGPVHVLGWEDDLLHPFELAMRVADAARARLERIAPLPAIFVSPETVGRSYRPFLEGLSD